MIESMFFIPLVHLKVNNWNQKKNNLIHLYESELNNVNLSDNIYTNFHQNQLKIISNIESIFQEELEKFCTEISFSECSILNAWFELASKNCLHAIHNHGGTGYSSVCFINYNKEFHTPTKFISPFLNFLTGDTLYYCPKDVDEGSIIFFPSAINHYTELNTSNYERLIVSFNLGVK